MSIIWLVASRDVRSDRGMTYDYASNWIHVGIHRAGLILCLRGKREEIDFYELRIG